VYSSFKKNTHVLRSRKNLKFLYFRIRFIYECFHTLYFDGYREERKKNEFLITLEFFMRP